ncbi:hypothetical protein D5366_08470 [Neokomagataea tanensis]|uniref:Probable branched-chain-amino-acid aminotransferase n=2 Tax=Neokomagataea TaxID=1223423 RepID=A0A4Y6V563_9PROT|nr:aminotransferase class IV [Neokomagataea tanensis]QDH25242.1 hypothetical protein D5366_08470 [Neokomagataea tanensis]
MTGYVWLNTALVPHSQGHIPHTDRGFLLADGLFETLRVTDGMLPHFTQHIHRMCEGCKILRIPLPDITALSDACTKVIHSNTLKHGSIRITLTRGSGPRGIAPPQHPIPTLLITAAASSPAQTTSISVCTSQYTRPPLSPLSSVKTLNYLPSILAKIDAQEKGFQDAILRSSDGKSLACGTSGTLIVAYKNKLLTPPLTTGALPGTTRARLLKKNICSEEIVTKNTLNYCDASWVVSSLSCLDINKINNTVKLNYNNSEITYFKEKIMSIYDNPEI